MVWFGLRGDRSATGGGGDGVADGVGGDEGKAGAHQLSAQQPRPPWAGRLRAEGLLLALLEPVARLATAPFLPHRW